ncbi:MAG: chemotaxis protein CheX [Planctomycetota bacterium]
MIPKNEMDQRVVQMMERMCFVLVDPMDEDHGAAANHRANIDFWGDQCRGNVSIEASDGFLLEVASSLLGLEPEDLDDSDCSAAIKELANMTCGELLELMGAEDKTLHCGLPEDGAWSSDSTPLLLKSAFDSMGEVFRIAVQVKECKETE